MLTSPLNSARGRPAAPVGGDPLLHPKGGVVKLEMMQKQLLRAEAAAEMESAVCRGDLAAFETRLDHWRSAGVVPGSSGGTSFSFIASAGSKSARSDVVRQWDVVDSPSEPE
ncbi:hypothetical protein Ctob_003258 [Chrysochromulina tobinii]|uniref:Uncharacterized protein n=1 Tax=Chrysochromulina tobinii TaxID=1460289 RepID=A0A0M0J919_9EUKA|nr:hypothetical protein Ctob_003258 [Chrysochromulina tobinii]|eukprot:KOO22950.1 hypothetical protein Ctob_003258 [Chrysochromulina sp. CCMP291]